MPIYKIKSLTLKQRKGAAVLLTVIFLSAAILAITLSLGLSSITESIINISNSQSVRTKVAVDGCAEEALTKLNRNHLYSGENLSYATTDCEITVTGNGTNRTILINGTDGNHTKSIQLSVTIFPTFVVNSWSELN